MKLPGERNSDVSRRLLMEVLIMANNKVTKVVEALAKPIVEELVGTGGMWSTSVKAPNWYLRVYIDKDGGVTLDDCEAVNGPLGEKLDEIDTISQAYIFEVSSPGVERPFKTNRDYEKALGQKVKIKFFKAVDGSKTVEGILQAFNGENVTVLIDNNNTKTYPLELISKINRVILF